MVCARESLLSHGEKRNAHGSIPVARILLWLVSMVATGCSKCDARDAPGETLPTTTDVPKRGDAATNPVTTSIPGSAKLEKVDALGHVGVVVPKEAWRNEEKKHWTPTRVTILAFERGLRPFVQSTKPAALEVVDHFHRQYTGILDDGEEVLEVEFFCREVEEWGERPVTLFDGWGCHATIQYVPGEKTYRHFIANGYPTGRKYPASP
jgi:hypothetical protein